jgi:hypothetical protein
MRNEEAPTKLAIEMRNKQGAMSFSTRFVAVFIFFCSLCWNAAAQGRGGDNETGAVEIADARKVPVQGKQWAVFIAIDDYTEWDPLQYPVKDAQEIKKILLDNYYFDEVRELYNRNATAEAIRKLFIELQNKTGPNDSVFVFHAGHGFKDDTTDKGAWLPSDAGQNYMIKAGWIGHDDIRAYLEKLPAKHVFLVSDSCYSGDLLVAQRGTPETIINYPAAYDKVSRQAMSSGASEQVDDVSEFASRLKSTLLRTETPYITPDYLLSQIKEVQTTRPLNTIPILAVIPGRVHQLGGSFLFFRKNPRQNLPELPAQKQETTPVSNHPVTTTYKIGDTGPAGGIVFYDKGAFSNGWQYLEAAPNETEVTAAQWGAYAKDVTGTNTVVGNGKKNTEIIIERLKQLSENGKAAQVCANINFDGYNDWFLPNKEELDWMYKNLKQKGLGGFSNNWYWTSSQFSNGGAWVQNFNNGSQSNFGKNNNCSVRAIRAF